MKFGFQQAVEPSWNRSVGTMSKKPLSGLVRVKKPESAVASPPPQDKVSLPSNKPSSLLSLVGDYPDSDDDSTSN